MDNKVMLVPGEMIAANGSQYHVRRWGSNGPTILLETGLTMMSACWGWLAPALAETNRVIAYDRAGLGWSDEREGLRDAAQIGTELEGLWKAMRIEEPVVLIGHSMGSLFNRAYYRLTATMISAMIWLDPAHPDQLPRSRRMRAFFFLLEFAHLLARRNLPSITLRIVPHLRGLQEQDYGVIKRFLKNPRHLRACAREARAWKFSADHVAGVTLGDVPLLVLSAQKSALRNWTRYQQELAALSSQSRQVIFTEMSHLSMLVNRDHAGRVADEINGFVAKL